MKNSELGPAWGTVSKVTGGVYVIVQTVARDYQLGPCEVLDHVTMTGTEVTETHDHGGTSVTTTHPSNVAPLAVGDRVLVSFVNGSADRPVIIGRTS